MKQNKSFASLILILLIVCISGCYTRNENIEIAQPEITELKAHQWFYFSKDNFIEIDLPQNVPDTAIKPWTEAIRLCSAGTSEDISCALVNKLGILDFSSDNPFLVKDTQLFNNVTSDTLLFTPDGPAFHLYRNTLFNGNSQKQEEARPLIAIYDSNRKICVPTLYYQDFGISSEAQITNILPKNGHWFAVIKSTEKDKTNFTYLKFATPTADGSIPNPKEAVITTTEIDADTFRKIQMPEAFQNAPDILKQLFSSIPYDFEFYLSARIKGQIVPVLFDNTELQSPSGGYTCQGYAEVISDTQAAALFSDGTTYITNSLLTDAPLSEGITVFRLPKLPAGFVYTEMTISGSTLYAGWEQSDFYKVGKSGFIKVNLEEIANRIPSLND